MTLILCVRAAKYHNSMRVFILSYAAQAERISGPDFCLNNFIWQIGESDFFFFHSGTLLQVNLQSAHLLYIKVSQNTGDEAV